MSHPVSLCVSFKISTFHKINIIYAFLGNIGEGGVDLNLRLQNQSLTLAP